jgi:thiol:disulfide interchange protein DsbC
VAVEILFLLKTAGVPMIGKRLVVLLALCGAAAWSALPAQQTSQASQASQTSPKAADQRAEIAGHIPGTRPDDLRASPIAGVYELTRGTDIAYVTADGKYAFTGDLYDLAKNDNITERRRRDLRVKAIAAVPESEMVIFGPADPKYTVTVFTDVDCPYCRKLHSQIAEYNRLGVRVRYLFFPRSGPNTASWTKAEQVWCSADRKDALTRAKLGQELKSKPCANNPVARTYALGKDFAIEGTPAIVIADGELLGGYVPPDVLVQHLKDGPSK